jgi:hypothetical protein
MRRWISGSVGTSTAGAPGREASPEPGPRYRTVQSQRWARRPPSRTGGNGEARQTQVRWGAVRPRPGAVDADADAAICSPAPHGHRLATAANNLLPASTVWSVQPETRLERQGTIVAVKYGSKGHICVIARRAAQTTQEDQRYPGNEQCNRDVTPCMPCSFGLLPHPRSGSRSPAQRSSRVTVTDRLHTARDRCLWHAGGTAGDHHEARI